MMKSLLVCDFCERPPNGESPDTVMVNPYGCGHDLCNECDRGACRVCARQRADE